MVRSLTLLEPPHMTVPSAQQLLEAVASVLAIYQAGDAVHAVDQFMSLIGHSNWRAMIGRRVPGAPRQMEKDAASFFESDWPAIQAWHFSRQEARTIKQPVLFIGGSDSGPFFDQVRDLLCGWLPQTEVVTLAGANHTLAITHAADVATALASFLQRHRQAVP
jgi:pimeloyl-ACP methyl ester carboxylesterase